MLAYTDIATVATVSVKVAIVRFDFPERRLHKHRDRRGPCGGLARAHRGATWLFSPPAYGTRRSQIGLLFRRARRPLYK